MAFDPDKYLSNSTGFDPDAYLRSKDESSMVPSVNVGAPQAALEGFAERASFGSLPKLQALAGSILPSPTADIDKQLAEQGFKVNQAPSDYESLKKEFANRQAQISKEQPLAYGAGQLGGSIATSIPIAKGLGAISALSKAGPVALGTLAGGISGLAETPLDESLTDRFKTAATGAAFGLGGELVGKGLQAAGSYIKRLPESFESIAGYSGLKAAGGVKKHFDSLFSKPAKAEDVMLKLREFVKPGDAVQDVFGKSSEAKNIAGQELGTIYQQAVDTLDNPSFVESLNNTQKAEILNSDLNPLKITEEAIDSVKKAFRGKADAKKAIAAAESQLENLQALGQSANIKDIQEFKVSLNNLINYDRPVKDSIAVQNAYKEIEHVLSDKIQKRIEVLGDVLGTDVKSTLLKANKDYGSYAAIEGMAKDRIARETSNLPLGLLDTGVGLAALTQQKDLSPESIAKAAAFGVGSRALRRYGPGFGVGVGNIGSKLAIPAVPVGSIIEQLGNVRNIAPGVLGGASSSMSRRLKALKESQ